MLHANELTELIIGAAMEVHTQLGPGLLESAYLAAMRRELQDRGVAFRSEVPLPVTYKGERIECGYRVDLLIDERVVVELKCVEAFEPIHEAQLLTYLKLGGWKIGLLINFNVTLLKNGIKRRVLDWNG